MDATRHAPAVAAALGRDRAPLPGPEDGLLLPVGADRRPVADGERTRHAGGGRRPGGRWTVDGGRREDAQFSGCHALSAQRTPTRTTVATDTCHSGASPR